MNKKIRPRAILQRTLRNLKRRHKVIVFTNGCFDLLHRGHIEYLKKARSLGDLLVVGLNSDRSVRRLKGPSRPVTGQSDRAEILSSLEFVDFVTIFNEDTPLNLIKALHPDILVKGADWKRADVVGGDIVESYGGKIVLVKYKKGFSTSGIIKELSKK